MNNNIILLRGLQERLREQQRQWRPGLLLQERLLPEQEPSQLSGSLRKLWTQGMRQRELSSFKTPPFF
jgi:hypothetical protein